MAFIKQIIDVVDDNSITLYRIERAIRIDKNNVKYVINDGKTYSLNEYKRPMRKPYQSLYFLNTSKDQFEPVLK